MSYPQAEIVQVALEDEKFLAQRSLLCVEACGQAMVGTRSDTDWMYRYFHLHTFFSMTLISSQQHRGGMGVKYGPR